jgi:hypothetical protein
MPASNVRPYSTLTLSSTYPARLVLFVDFVPRDTIVYDVIEGVVVTFDACFEEPQFFVNLLVVILRFGELGVDTVAVLLRLPATPPPPLSSRLVRGVDTVATLGTV